MREQAGGIRASRVTALPRPNRIYGEGRVCAAEGCDTRLSVYNKKTFCYLHAPLTFPILRGRKPRSDRPASEAA